MARKLIFSLVGLLIFVIYIIVQLPAAPFWNMARDKIQSTRPDLQLLGVSGRIWHGAADLRYQDFPISQLDWQIHSSRLLILTLLSDLRLEGEGHRLDANIKVTSSLASIANLHGYVDASYINTVSQAQGLTFSGRITGTDLNLVSDHHWLQAASGQIHWPGGNIITRLGLEQPQRFNLPALVGNISMIDQTLWLHIYEKESYEKDSFEKESSSEKSALLSIAVKPNGMASVTILARLSKTAGLPFASGLQLDEPVLEFEEKIF